MLNSEYSDLNRLDQLWTFPSDQVYLWIPVGAPFLKASEMKWGFHTYDEAKKLHVFTSSRPLVRNMSYTYQVYWNKNGSWEPCDTEDVTTPWCNVYYVAVT